MRYVVRFAAFVALVGVFGCNENKPEGAAMPEVKPSAAAMTAPSAAPVVSAAAPKVEASAAAAPVDSAAAAPTEVASAAASAAAAPATSAAAASGPKTFDCGAKGQKACPMQGWMKGVMGPATSSGDAEKIAKGLDYIAAKPPPGMGNWSSIAKTGAAKAKAGDIDGAKASCKICHDQYKEKYKTTLRDKPW